MTYRDTLPDAAELVQRHGLAPLARAPLASAPLVWAAFALATLSGAALIAPLDAQQVTVPREATSVVARGAESRAAVDDLFPPASENLALAWPSDGAPPALLDLVSQYGQLTGQRVLYDNETEQYLRNARTPIDRPTTVASADVQGFFESILVASDFALTIERTQNPRLVRVHSLRTAARNLIRSSARFMTVGEIAIMRAHPALLFTTIVDLPNTDVRQVSNSMRTMITDANTMSMLPAGNSTTMVLTGFGPIVAGMIEQLRLIDSASKIEPPKIVHELVLLEHASAVGIAPLVSEALNSARAQRGENALIQVQPGQAPTPHTDASVLADARLNALLITCVADELVAARQVVALLDVAAKSK